MKDKKLIDDLVLGLIDGKYRKNELLFCTCDNCNEAIIIFDYLKRKGISVIKDKNEK